MFTRSTLIPIQYEVCIYGKIVSEHSATMEVLNKVPIGERQQSECSMEISIRQSEKSAREAAILAVSKLRQLLAHLPEITVFSNPVGKI